MTLHRGFEVNVISGISAAAQDTWDRAAGDRPFASYAWYGFCETVLVDYKPFYIIVSHQGEPVARSTFWVAPREPLPIASKAVRTALQPIFRHWPLFVCRSPLVNGSGLILPEPPLQETALSMMAQAAQKIGQQHHASFTIFDYLEPTSLNWPPGYTHYSAFDPSTYLDIRWSDFKSYLADLSQSARKDYRRHNNRAIDQGIKITIQDTITELDRALALIRSVEQHHQTPPNTAASKLFKYASQMHGQWITAHIDDQLVGCGLLLGNGPWRYLTLLGLDYSVNYVYFQLFYAAIQTAIESGTNVLYAGSGAYDFKQRLGFQIKHDNHLVYRAGNRGLHWLTKRFGS